MGRGNRRGQQISNTGGYVYVNSQSISTIADFVFADLDDNCNTRMRLDVSNLNDGDIIYCKTDHIQKLFTLIRDFDASFKLITHQSDYPITETLFNQRPKCIKKWYAQNAMFNHPDLIGIPIGIANSYSSAYNLMPSDIEAAVAKNLPRNKRFYMNFNPSTNPRKRAGLWDRAPDVVTKEFGISEEKYAEALCSHDFTICPPGNGIDTHRIWEALYCGSVPVVEWHPAHWLMRNSPVFFVHNLNEIFHCDKAILDFELFKSQRELPNSRILKIDYWKSLIRNG